VQGMPFMPEMVAHAGRRFTVSHRVEKICDTAGGTTASRRVQRTVLLEDLRCDGSAHDGCQAGCRIYWREEWLRPVGGEPLRAATDVAGPAGLESLSRRATRTLVPDQG